VNNTLAIVTHYRRTDNTLKLADALLSQSEPCDVVIVDNGPGASLSSTGKIPSGVKDVWRWRENAGPACRFAPAWMMGERYQYVLCLDDDLLPGHNCVRYLLYSADVLKNEFSTLGQIGRRVRSRRGVYSYRKRNVPRSGKFEVVDITCRAHFFRADLAGIVAMARSQMIASKAKPEFYRHDDLQLCLGLQKATGWSSYLIPACPPSAQMIAQNLDDGVSRGVPSVSSVPTHVQDRTELIQLFASLGWKPIRPEVIDENDE